MMVLTFTQPVPWVLKVATALGVTAVYAFLYRGWSLYLGRACRTVQRCGYRIEMLLAGKPRAETVIRSISEQ